MRVHVFLDAKWATLYLDTSGEPLFKRGRRAAIGEASVKKNLAAGILRLAGWEPGIAAPRSDVRRGHLPHGSGRDVARLGAGTRARLRLREARCFDAQPWES